MTQRDDEELDLLEDIVDEGEEAEEERPDAESLGGESEYSLSEAERTIPQEPEVEEPALPDRREPLNPDVDDLGRRYLEDATGAPAHPQKSTLGSIEARPLADLLR